MIIYITTRLVVADGSDPQQIAADCDYSFEHPDIIETEIIEAEEKE